MVRKISLFVAILGAATASAQPVPGVRMPAEIGAAYGRLGAAVMAHDADGVRGVWAEDFIVNSPNITGPRDGFRPNAGLIERWEPPVGPNVRVDTHCHAGNRVPVFYVSMLAKLIVDGSTRAEAIQRMRRSLDRFVVTGVETTIPFLRFMTAREEFASGAVTTHLIEDVLPLFVEQVR